MGGRRSRIGLCGLGSIGSASARLLLDYRTGFDLVGAVTLQPDAVGRSLRDVVGAETPTDVVVGSDLDELLACEPDLIVLCTGSFLGVVSDDVLKIAGAGVSVVSPCEELAFPFARDPEFSARLDQVARSAGATIVGTGVNPGFIFDGLLAAASGSAWDVLSIRGRRVVDVSGFGQNIHLRLGIGYTEEEFTTGHDNGRIAGHVGFPESIRLVARRLGILLDEPILETFDPMIAAEDVATPYGGVGAGRTEGFLQRAVGTVEGRAFIELELLLHLRPLHAGFATSDSFAIAGTHPVNVEMNPGMDAIPATSAQLVNSIPAVLRAPAGLLTITDLPSSTAWTDLSRSMFT